MRQLMRFHAEWCMPCKASAPAWKKFKEGNPSLFDYVDVDVDKEPALAKTFGVQSVPALVLIEDDKNFRMRIGSFTEGDLIKFTE